MTHDPYKDMCRCKPEGSCYGLAPYESLCKVFVAEETVQAPSPPIIPGETEWRTSGVPGLFPVGWWRFWRRASEPKP